MNTLQHHTENFQPGAAAKTIVDQQLGSHRLLTEAEAQMIWTLLNGSALPHSIQEMRIVLKPDDGRRARGWVVCRD